MRAESVRDPSASRRRSLPWRVPLSIIEAIRETPQFDSLLFKSSLDLCPEVMRLLLQVAAADGMDPSSDSELPVLASTGRSSFSFISSIHLYSLASFR